MLRRLEFIVALGALLLGTAAARPQDAPKTDPAAPVKVVEMNAKKYEYSPEQIRVKKGERVQLKIHALDRTHGFKISLYPEGAAKDGPPGLRFDPQQESYKIEKDDVRTIEFVAGRAGTYEFKCSVFCGFGHRGMKGKLIVEE